MVTGTEMMILMTDMRGSVWLCTCTIGFFLWCCFCVCLARVWLGGDHGKLDWLVLDGQQNRSFKMSNCITITHGVAMG